MLWSLLKIVIFVAIVAALTLGGIYLLELDGGVRIAVAGMEYNLTPFMAVIALALLVIAVWVGLKLLSLLVAVLRFINGDETAISRHFNRSRQRKGLEALSDGVMALASGDGHEAMAKAAKAEKYLERPALTNLITAQGAELAGDRVKAERVYKQLLTDDKTRFVGVRGIMRQKLADGDTDTALKLAETAFALKPKHPEVQDTLLKLQAQKKDWSGARKTLTAKLKHGTLPRDVHKRRDAVLALSEAKDVLDEGNTIEAREAAIEANRLSPDLIPAAVMAARSYIEQNKGRYAARVLTKAWSVQPHPDLAGAFAEIAPDETPAQRVKRFGKLVKSQPGHRESRLLMAEANIAAEDFPQARRELGDLVESDPDARVLTVMAAIERGEGANDEVIKGWLARALAAPRGPQWVCDNCHNVQGHWTPVCENCESFDTLSWTRPAAQEMAAPGAEMLPLIVGSIEDKSADAGAEDAEKAEPVDSSAEDSSAQAEPATANGEEPRK